MFALRGPGHIPLLPLFSVHLAWQKHLSALLGDKMFALLGDEMLALLGDEMLALLGDKMFALIDDKKFARLGDEMLGSDRDSARSTSNRDVSRPTHNNDRRESPSKSKGVVSLNHNQDTFKVS